MLVKGIICLNFVKCAPRAPLPNRQPNEVQTWWEATYLTMKTHACIHNAVIGQMSNVQKFVFLQRFA